MRAIDEVRIEETSHVIEDGLFKSALLANSGKLIKNVQVLSFPQED